VTLIPRTLLARTVITMILLLLFSMLGWLMLFSLYEVEPRAQQIATRAAAVVNLTRTALINAQPAKRRALLQALSDEQGIRVYAMVPEDVLLPPPANRPMKLLAQGLQARLGPQTLVWGGDDENDSLWISFAIGPDDYWLILPRVSLRPVYPWRWLAWAGTTLVFVGLGGWLLVARINRPLKQAADAAEKIGSGEFSARLPERGPLEIIALNRAFNRMGADLAALERDRSEMLAGLSHDLRTPLARVKLSIEMAVADDAERQALQNDLDDMDALTRQFLDFARPLAKQESLELDACFMPLVERYQSLGMSINGMPAAASGRGDCTALRRALTNLLENARRYGQAPVHVAWGRRADQLWLNVHDSGNALPASEVERLRQPFVRGDAARTGASGAGLGLAIVERIATQHGGRLLLSSAPGRGLEARLEWPANQKLSERSASTTAPM
jgi:two-component system osmolarity sensor histidine kinase EnvZ